MTNCQECWLPLPGEANDGTVHELCNRLLAADYAATEVRDDRDLETVEADLRRQRKCSWQISPGGWDGSARYCGRPASGEFCLEHECEAGGNERDAADEHFAHTRMLRDRHLGGAA